MTVIEDRSGLIWAGTFGGGISRINPAGGGITHFTAEGKHPLSSSRVMKLLQDKTGEIWVATFGGGLTRLDPATGATEKYTNDPMNPGSLSDNDIISLYEDRTGIIWIGTHLGKGINRYDRNRNKFTHYKNIPGDPGSLNDDVVWSFAEDKDGSIWIGTYRGGLNRFDKKSKKFTAIKKSPAGLSSNHIRSLYFDKSDRLWAGTYDAGISIFDKKTGKFTSIKNDPSNLSSLSNNQVLAIIQDRSGSIWAGTFGGGLNKLVRSDKNGFSFIRYTAIPGNPNSLSDNRVYTLLEDRSGFIWVGTFGGGLCRLDPQTGTFRTYSHDPQNPESLSENRVLSLYEDKTGLIWVGTFGGGLSSLDVRTGKFRKYTQDGYHSNVIYGILEDAGNYLWLSTDNGLMKMRKADSHFISFDLHDGVQSMEFSGGAYLKTSHGEMYFGGINGFNCFYPELILENTTAPPLVISSFKIFNREVSVAKNKIVLENKHNFFTFEFAALDFTNSEQNHYAYKLDGFDNEWHYTDASRRFASYTNLDPGKYVFRLRGSNNDGYWNEKGIEVAIQILPPFYLTWWFIALAVLFTAGTVTYFITGQIKHMLAIERLKGKLAADLHDSVGSGLTEISILSEVIAAKLCDAPEEIKERLKNINETSGYLIDNMSDIVWVVNPVRDTLHDLILRLRDNYADIFSSLGISFKINNLELLRSVKLPMEHKQNLYLIFKECINNCLKHSSCNALYMEASLHGRKLEIILKDNGTGFNINKNSQGNGLTNIKKRAKNIGGHLVIESAPGQGTLIKYTGHVPRFRSFILRHTE
ncbi:MAG: two-component regulator propeller domain-containing protein [Syntrophothermus sp.]